MIRTKLILALLWVAFIAYTLILAPLDQPGNLTLLEKLLKLQIADVNAYIVTLFSLMGVWPLVYACFLFIDARRQNIPAWPAFVASNGSGVIGMMPYLLLRHPNPEFRGSKDFWLRIWDSRITGIALLLSTIGLLVYALVAGDWTEFVQQWCSSRFVYLMSLDFLSLYLVFPALLGDDMARRGIEDKRIFWAVSLVPLLGPLIYLSWRTPLPD